MRFVTFVTFALVGLTIAQVKIDNALRDPEMVYQQQAEDTTQLCKIEGPPLDIMFVIDSSGSLRDQFKEQLNVVLRALNNLAISEDSVRVAIIQYASVPHIRFGFNTYFNRADMVKRVEAFTTTGSTTNTGRALKLAYEQWTEDNGMRPDRENVKRIIFLLSDGRSSDYPEDVNHATKLRDNKNIEFYAFGLGEHIDWPVLRQVISGTRNEGYNHVVNSRNQTEIAGWIKPWKGVEICEEVPVCIPGAERPLDLLFIVDSSTSVHGTFENSINFVRRALNSVNVHPQATRVGLIVYSSQPSIVWNFYDRDTQNNTAVLDKLLKVTAVEGTTKTAAALKVAFDMFGAQGDVIRPNAERLAIVITDGFSSDRPATFARRLIELKDVDIFAVSLNSETVADRQRQEQELLTLTGHDTGKIFPVKQRVFSKGHNLMDFEAALLKYTDKACPSLNIAGAADAVPVIQQPTTTKCNSQGMRVTMRLKAAFNGAAYAIGFAEKAGCHITGSGEREITMTIAHGSCGLQVVNDDNTNQQVSAFDNGMKKFRVRIGLRFHEFFDTISDEVVTAECEYGGDIIGVNNDRPSALTVSNPSEASCDYRISPRNQGCEVLDAEVGKQITHEWTCRGLSPRQYIFVHDCVVDADSVNSTVFNMLSDEGCEVDKYLMETPTYGINEHPHKVSVNTYVVKQPADTIVRYRCLISICDRDALGECRFTFSSRSRTGQVTRIRATPDKCLDHPEVNKIRRPSDVLNYNEPLTKPQYAATHGVEARRINVFHRDVLTGVEESNDRRFCKGF